MYCKIYMNISINYIPCVGDADDLSNGKFSGYTAREHLGYHLATTS